MERVNTELAKVKADTFQRTTSTLEADKRKKYRPVLPLMDSVISASRRSKNALDICKSALKRKEGFSDEKRRKHLSTLVQNLARSTANITSNYQQFLEKQRDSFALLQVEIDQYKQQVLNQVMALDTRWDKQTYLTLPDDELLLLLTKTKTDIIQREALLVYHLAQLTGSFYCINNFVIYRRPFFFSTS